MVQAYRRRFGRDADLLVAVALVAVVLLPSTLRCDRISAGRGRSGERGGGLQGACGGRALRLTVRNFAVLDVLRADADSRAKRGCFGMDEAGGTGFVYVLGCAAPHGFLTYVGWTNDLDRRLAMHNAGTGAKSTKGRVWTMLYAERLPSRRAAMSREWHLKRDRVLRRRLALAAQGVL